MGCWLVEEDYLQHFEAEIYGRRCCASISDGKFVLNWFWMSSSIINQA